MVSIAERLEVALGVSHEDLNPRGEAWFADRQRLTRELKNSIDIDSVDLVEKLTEGAKGGIGEVVVALANAGAFGSLVLIVRAWLAKDKARRVQLSVKRDGREFNFSAESVRHDDVEKLVAALVQST
jgi:hypothetical protein